MDEDKTAGAWSGNQAEPMDPLGELPALLHILHLPLARNRTLASKAFLEFKE